MAVAFSIGVALVLAHHLNGLVYVLAGTVHGDTLGCISDPHVFLVFASIELD